MKSHLIFFAVLGSLLLWLGSSQAASPRFDNWGDWQAKEVETEKAKPASKATPDTVATTEETLKTKAAATKNATAEAPVTKVMARPVSAKVDTDEVTTLGPPTKGRRVSVNTEDDRSTPTPAPKVVVTQTTRGSKSTTAKAVDEGENLSWWERWKRRREGRALAPVIVPESHVYSVRVQEAQWSVAATRLECKLYQSVPRLGKVMFQQRIGTDLEFRVVLNRAYEQIHQANFESIPPTWGHQSHKRALAIPASMQAASVTVPREGAVRLINELLEGMAPRMTYRMGAEESSDEVVVTLSGRTFAQKLQMFQDCIDNLLPFKFDEVKESIVFFNFDSAELTAEAKKALTRVAEYVRLDEAVKRIVIEGHTDNKGFRRYNYRLATQRARAVEKFFLEQGVSKSRLVLRSKAIGEKKPVASNKSATGRAKNRRVHISLFK